MEAIEGKLRSLCVKNAQQLFNELTPVINERLEFELRQIQALQMENTFLVCYHLAQLVEKGKGLIGPSSAFSSGSFVLYLLGVSMVNPVEHGLLFEHFFPVNRIGTIAIGMEVDIDSLDQIRNQLIESDFLFDNLQIEESLLCSVLELSIDNNIIQLNGCKLLTYLLEKQKDSNGKLIEFESLVLDDKNVFQKLISNYEIVNMRKINSGFLARYTQEQEDFLNQFAPKSIEKLAQVLVYIKPWCQYDLNSILKRRKGEKDLTQFQKKYFSETNGIYTFPEQVSFMLKDYMGFSSQQIYSYCKGERKKIPKLQMACEEMYYKYAYERDYDIIDMERIMDNIMRYNKNMTDKTRVVGEALLIYWWGYSMANIANTHK